VVLAQDPAASGEGVLVQLSRLAVAPCLTLGMGKRVCRPEGEAVVGAVLTEVVLVKAARQLQRITGEAAAYQIPDCVIG
jgi:hypothetical protein